MIDKDKKIRLGIVAASAVFHTVILFCVIAVSKSIPVEAEEAVLVQLVNVSEYKEEAPAPKVMVKPPPPVKEKPPEIVPVQEERAEIIIETEEEPVVTETAEVAVVAALPSSTAASGNGTATD
ncbi:MAG: hypothetical protein LBO04_07855, partial [Spirochaetaceae bacterium]|nr:hypothetical protein [Spirochaetaceae bacterium]